MPRSTKTNACVESTWNFRRVTKQLTTKLAKQTTPATFVTESTEANGAKAASSGIVATSTSSARSTRRTLRAKAATPTTTPSVSRGARTDP